MFKLKELVHYICAQCAEDPSKLGSTKLNKILWFVDTFAFLHLGHSVSGIDAYIKRQYGPVPRRILSVIEDLEFEGKIRIRETAQGDFLKREFEVLIPPSLGIFTDQETQIINNITRDVCDLFTAQSISELSHDNVWEAANDGEEIPLYAVLAKPDDLTDDDREWFRKQVETFSPPHA
jgi:hypothetical protein